MTEEYRSSNSTGPVSAQAMNTLKWREPRRKVPTLALLTALGRRYKTLVVLSERKLNV
jgi:hypothetical protein